MATKSSGEDEKMDPLWSVILQEKRCELKDMQKSIIEFEEHVDRFISRFVVHNGQKGGVEEGERLILKALDMYYISRRLILKALDMYYIGNKELKVRRFGSTKLIFKLITVKNHLQSVNSDVRKKALEALDRHIRRTVIPAIQCKSGAELLKEFARQWDIHKRLCRFLSGVFYSNTHASFHLRMVKTETTILSMSLLKFKKVIQETTGKETGIVDEMMKLIRKHRHSSQIDASGEIIDEQERQILENCKDILVTMGVMNHEDFTLVTQFLDYKGKDLTILPLQGKDSWTGGIEVGNCIDVYKQAFESPFLCDSKKFFESKREELLVEHKDDKPKYFKAVDKLLQAEISRVNEFLHKSTRDPLLKVFAECMLLHESVRLPDEIPKRAEDQFKLILRDKDPHKNEQFKRIYGTYTYPPRLGKLAKEHGVENGSELFATIFKKYIIEQGNELIEKRKKRIEKKKQKKKLKVYDPPHDPAFVGEVLEIYRKCNLLYIKVFESSAAFRIHMGKGFEEIFNHDWGGGRYQTAHFIAHYLDMLLRGKYLGRKNVPDDEINKVCDDVVEMFKYLRDRDIFIDSSKRLMAFRLLNPKFKTFSREREILSRLKAEVGGQNIGELHYMLTERDKQKEVQADWEKSGWCKSSDGKPFVPQTCRESAWTMPEDKLGMGEVPKQVKSWMQDFEKYYSSKHDSRQLTYRHDLSFVELEYTCGDWTYRIAMKAPQASVLLMFTSKDKVLQLKDVQSALQINNGSHVKALLLTMLKRPMKDASSGIIEQVLEDGEKPSKDLKPTSTFRLSSSFKTTYLKFELPKLNLGGAAAPKRPQRNWRLDAALVRTMKANRVLAERKLIDKVMELCEKMFIPDVKDVKCCIEKLIKKGYMERSKEDKKEIKYCS